MSGDDTKREPTVDHSDNEDLILLNKSDAEPSDDEEIRAKAPELDGHDGPAEGLDSSKQVDQALSQRQVPSTEGEETAKPNDSATTATTKPIEDPAPESSKSTQTLHGYQIPDWFLAHNVRTSEELNSDATQPPCRIHLTGDGAKGAKSSSCTESDKGATMPNLPEFELAHEVFTALRDLTAAALVPEKDGKLSRSCLGPVIRGLTDDEIPFLSGLLQLMAKEFNASLVTLNWEDLEDLGREFDRQDRGKLEGTSDRVPPPQPPVASDTQEQMVDSLSSPPESKVACPGESPKETRSIRELAAHYFSCWPQKNSKPDDWNRVQTAIDTVLDSHVVKSRRSAADSTPAASNTDLGVRANSPPESEDVVDEDPIVLVHIEAANKVANMTGWRSKEEFRSLCRFADNVITRRCRDSQPGRGTRVVLIGSIIRNTSEWFYNENWERWQTQLADYLCVGVSGNVLDLDSHLTSLYYPKEEGQSQASTETVEKTAAFMKRTRNLSLLKRALRENISHLFTEEVRQMLKPTVTLEDPWKGWLSDDGKDGGEKDKKLGQHYWKPEEVDAAVAQMRGRALKKQLLDMEDIRVVLSRAGLIDKRTSKEATAGDTSPAEESGEKEEVEDTKKPETWAERIERIKDEANEVELDLIPSVVNPDCINVTFADVVMDPSTKDHLETLISLTTTSSSSPASFIPLATSRFLKSQLRLSSTLLYGPPGTGKTHLARAIASSFPGSSFLAVDAATLVGRYTGETEKAIKAAFTLARKLSPCVLFIDEVDALFYKRKGDDKSWERSALAQFLMEMDGINSSVNSGEGGQQQQPFVVVATNRPQDLDEAFYRRLPSKVYFGLPGKEARAQILEGLVGGDLNLDVDGQEKDKITVDELAEKTEGYSGSDLKNLCGEAALIWAVEMVKKREKEVKTGEEERQAGKEEEGAGAGEEKKKMMKKEADEIKVRLGASHFTMALTKIRPSVSPVEDPGLKQFMKRFNPGASREVREVREVRESHPSQKWVQYHRGPAGPGPI